MVRRKSYVVSPNKLKKEAMHFMGAHLATGATTMRNAQPAGLRQSPPEAQQLRAAATRLTLDALDAHVAHRHEMATDKQSWCTGSAACEPLTTFGSAQAAPPSPLRPPPPQFHAPPPPPQPWGWASDPAADAAMYSFAVNLAVGGLTGTIRAAVPTQLEVSAVNVHPDAHADDVLAAEVYAAEERARRMAEQAADLANEAQAAADEAYEEGVRAKAAAAELVVMQASEEAAVAVLTVSAAEAAVAQAVAAVAEQRQETADIRLQASKARKRAVYYAVHVGDYRATEAWEAAAAAQEARCRRHKRCAAHGPLTRPQHTKLHTAPIHGAAHGPNTQSCTRSQYTGQHTAPTHKAAQGPNHTISLYSIILYHQCTKRSLV
jgi:hypothetical protein